MAWIVVLFLLILIFGLGSVLEAAFWTMLLVALVVVVAGAFAASALGRGRSA